MFRFSILFAGLLASLFCINVYAEDTTTTVTTTTTPLVGTPTVTTGSAVVTTPVTVTTTPTAIAVPNSAVVVTTVPAPKETMVAPQGYSYCFTVKAGWFNQAWVPEHTVCQYDQSKAGSLGGIAWVEGYWACTKFKTTDPTSAECTNWDWKPGRWVKTLSVF